MKMRMLLEAVAVLVPGVSVLSGHLSVAVNCPRAVQSFQVSQTATLLGICFKESHVGRCDVYTYELPLVRD
jgi:hypothetical protein